MTFAVFKLILNSAREQVKLQMKGILNGGVSAQHIFSKLHCIPKGQSAIHLNAYLHTYRAWSQTHCEYYSPNGPPLISPLPVLPRDAQMIFYSPICSKSKRGGEDTVACRVSPMLMKST